MFMFSHLIYVIISKTIYILLTVTQKMQSIKTIIGGRKKGHYGQKEVPPEVHRARG